MTLRKTNSSAAYATLENKKKPAVKFCYYENGNLVNYKLRTIDTKDFRAMVGGKQVWFNQDNVLKGLADNKFTSVYVVEGEFDACALIECGLENVLSLPSGSLSLNENSNRQLEFLERGDSSGLEKVKTWIFLTDNDDSGYETRKVLAQYFGKGRSKFCDWPDGIKDANEALLTMKDGLLHYIQENTKDWPIEGRYLWKDLPKEAPPTLWRVDMKDINGRNVWYDRYRLGCPSLSVFTGGPGHGKTLFSQWMWANIIKQYGIKIMLLSLETGFREVEMTFLSAYFGKLYKDMTEYEISEGRDWMHEHVIPYVCLNPTPTELFRRIEDYYQRDGISAVLVDPWNRFTRDKGEYAKPETEWIRHSLCHLHEMSKQARIHIQICAHPAKPNAMQQVGNLDVHQISGSAAWGDVSDFISKIERTSFRDDTGKIQSDARVTILKTRNNLFGNMHDFFEVKYNSDKGIYESTEQDEYAYSTAIQGA